LRQTEESTSAVAGTDGTGGKSGRFCQTEQVFVKKQVKAEGKVKLICLFRQPLYQFTFAAFVFDFSYLSAVYRRDLI